MGSRGRKQMTIGQRPVSELDRINIEDRLEEFRASPAIEMTFESDLSNHDRAVVHDFCKKMGFKSKSYGKGAERSVTVSKSAVDNLKTKETQLSISANTQNVISELFTRFPPTEEEEEELKHMRGPENSRPAHRKPVRAQAPLAATDIAKQVASLADRIKRLPALQQIVHERSKLPIAQYEDAITSAVDNHQVVLIAGETGCGKTTQVPQFILQHMWSEGKACRVICTQPRRISAISVAERIAAERGEPVGTTVGYQIRLETKGGRHSSLMFQTNGVLLRKLVKCGGHSARDADADDESEDGVDATHVIVDEIHERDRNADFLLIVLRDLLPVRPDLRLILMSATLDSDLFSRYFGGCPVITVPGFTYPVRTYFLEDVLSLLETPSAEAEKVDDQAGDQLIVDQGDADAMDNAMAVAWLDDDFEELMNLVTECPRLCNYQHSHTGATALMFAAGKGHVDDVSTLLSLGGDISITCEDGMTALDWANKHGQLEAAARLSSYKSNAQQKKFGFAQGPPSQEQMALLAKYQSNTDQEEIDVVLIERLLCHICRTSSDDGFGAILVFLPGWDDISRMMQQLATSSFFAVKANYLILPLHSMVPSSEQKKVFKRPPTGVRKIVLATNIAETAITIDDVVFVIDSGRAKEKSYDPYTNVSTLQTAWISKASLRQRGGRAGRCQPGVCYHLVSRLRVDAMTEYQLPEIKRAPLEELCLQVKLMQPDGIISTFLSKAIDPPLPLAVQNAVILLQDIGALTGDEKLTELGRQLGSLPVHPATSKMLLFSILMNCLDPALTIACAGSYRDPFVLPIAPWEKLRAAAAKREFAARFGGYSDHLAVVAAFEGWKAAKAAGREQQFCSENFVSGGTMAMLSGMRKQLQRELAQKGFISSEHHACSLNAGDPGIVRAVIAAGLYPMIGTLLPPLSGNQKVLVQTSRGQKVRIHPHSANFELNRKNHKEYQGAVIAFDEITRGERQVYLKNSTLVKPHPVLIISTEMVVKPVQHSEEQHVLLSNHGLADEQDTDSEEDVKDRPDMDVEREQKQIMSRPENLVIVVLDRWLEFQATALEAAALFHLRRRMLAAIKYKIEQPRAPLPDMLAFSVYTVACLLSYDGVLDLQPVDQSQLAARQPQLRGSWAARNQPSASIRGNNSAGGTLRGNGLGLGTSAGKPSQRSDRHVGGPESSPNGGGNNGFRGRGEVRRGGRGGTRQEGRGGPSNHSAGTTRGRDRKRPRRGGAG